MCYGKSNQKIIKVCSIQLKKTSFSQKFSSVFVIFLKGLFSNSALKSDLKQCYLYEFWMEELSKMIPPEKTGWKCFYGIYGQFCKSLQFFVLKDKINDRISLESVYIDLRTDPFSFLDFLSLLLWTHLTQLFHSKFIQIRFFK